LTRAIFATKDVNGKIAQLQRHRRKQPDRKVPVNETAHYRLSSNAKEGKHQESEERGPFRSRSIITGERMAVGFAAGDVDLIADSEGIPY
jgi:hypothetical protein